MKGPEAKSRSRLVEHTDTSKLPGVKIEPGQYRIYGDDIRYAKYRGGAHHLHRVDPETGTFLGLVASDEFLTERDRPVPPKEISDLITGVIRHRGSTEEEIRDAEERVAYWQRTGELMPASSDLDPEPEPEPRIDELREDIDRVIESHQKALDDLEARLISKIESSGRTWADDRDEIIRTMDEIRGELEGIKDSRRASDARSRKELKDSFEKLAKKLKKSVEKGKDVKEDKKDKKDKKPTADDPPPGPEEGRGKAAILAERKTLKEGIDGLRLQLAEVINRREGRMGDWFTLRPGRGRRDRALYQRLHQAYDEAIQTLLANHREEHEMDGMAENLSVSKLTLEGLREELLLVNEKQGVNDRKFQKILREAGPFKKARIKFVRWWAKMPTIPKIMLATIVGVPLGTVLGPAGAFGLIGLAGLGAFKFSQGLLGKEASAINQSERIFKRERTELEKQVAQMEAATNAGRALSLEFKGVSDRAPNFAESWSDYMRGNHDKKLRRRQWRNRVMGGLAMVGAGSVAFAGLEHATNIDWHLHWPFGWPFGHHSPPGGAGIHNYSDIKVSTIHAHNPDEFVKSVFGHHNGPSKGLLEQNGYKVDGLNNANAHAIALQIQNEHWTVASGISGHDAAGHIIQHDVDIANGFNNPSFDQGFVSHDELNRLISVAAQHNVTIRKA